MNDGEAKILSEKVGEFGGRNGLGCEAGPGKPAIPAGRASDYRTLAEITNFIHP